MIGIKKSIVRNNYLDIWNEQLAEFNQTFYVNDKKKKEKKKRKRKIQQLQWV